MNMTLGFDCAASLTPGTAAAFARDGYVFVARYLVPNSWKMLTRQEAETITAAGLKIVSVFETTANRPLTGRDGGLNDGAFALSLARTMGQPEGSAIYFAVDFDATADQMPLVIAYIRAASENTPGYNTGVYGSYAVIEAARVAGACSRFWQTYAWSRGSKSDAANIYQYENDILVHGIGVDLDESYGDEGWWNTAEPAQSGGQSMIMPEDANKMMGFLKAGLAAAPNPEAKAEFQRLANELRRVSGQPME
jgi:hypothetical protein